MTFDFYATHHFGSKVKSMKAIKGNNFFIIKKHTNYKFLAILEVFQASIVQEHILHLILFLTLRCLGQAKQLQISHGNRETLEHSWQRPTCCTKQLVAHLWPKIVEITELYKIIKSKTYFLLSKIIIIIIIIIIKSHLHV